MSKRGHDGQTPRRGGGGSKRSCRGKHLYLVLDDWRDGFSIHKMDADTMDSDAHDYLPEPALLRLESPIGPLPHACMFFSAMANKIFAFMNKRCALVYNTETAVMASGPHSPDRMRCGFGITLVSGDKLYALSYRFLDKHHSFEVMSWAPPARDHPTDEEGWSWNTLPAPPFASRQRVTSYALHPDGCTIFMTTANRDTPGRHLGTYSFNTKNLEWRWHGEWALPFLDQGYFDSELDAWVGLHKDGYICSCQVAPHSSSGAPQIIKLDCQRTKEKLFYKDLDTHMCASLTYLGRSKFCLLESVVREGQGFDGDYALGDHHGCVLHVTMFGLSYNRKGDLQTTNHKSMRSYLVSRHNSCFSPVAFWI